MIKKEPRDYFIASKGAQSPQRSRNPSSAQNKTFEIQFITRLQTWFAHFYLVKVQQGVLEGVQQSLSSTSHLHSQSLNFKFKKK